MTPNRRPTVTPPHVVSAEPSAEPSADQSAMKSNRRSWIRKIRRLRLREEHRTKLLRCHVEMFEDNLAIRFSVSPLMFRNHRKVIAELKREFEYWVLYGPISDEEKEEKEEKKEKEQVKSVGDFIKNWCNPNIEFLIFSYFAKSPFKYELTTQLCGTGTHRRFDGHKWNLVTDPPFPHRTRMNDIYAYTHHPPYIGERGGRVISSWELTINCGPRFPQVLHKNINTVVKQLWEMRMLSKRYWGAEHMRLSGKEIYNILEENNLGKNKTQRTKLSPHRVKSGSRIPAIKLLMSI